MADARDMVDASTPVAPQGCGGVLHPLEGSQRADPGRRKAQTQNPSNLGGVRAPSVPSTSPSSTAIRTPLAL